MNPRFASAAAIFLMGFALLRGQTTGPPQPALVIPSMAGEDLYRFYCASCHGPDGRGKGPVASVLRVAPADLTILGQRNGGAFPRDRVFRFVANGGTAPSGAHGSNEMPIWGPIFFSLDPSDTRAVIRIENIGRFLESIQMTDSKPR